MFACIYAYMASRNINIEVGVYDQLSRIKLENESFTEVLARLIQTQKSALKASFGALRNNPLDYEEIKKSRRDRDVVL